MNFYIKKIQLWFKRNVNPLCYEFMPNAVNIITGDSSTGKSSMLRIIDYCLLAPHSTIVEDVINENVKWYGMLFHLNGKEYTIIRKAPSIEIPDMDLYWSDEDGFPDYPIPNEKVANVTVILNQLFGIPDIRLLSGRKGVNLNFRHFLLFNYLTEDIIATINTYFDTKFFRSYEYDLILDDLFKLAIGVDELKERELINIISKAKKDLITYNNKIENNKKSKEKYAKDLENIAQKCFSLGLSNNYEVQSDLKSLARVISKTVDDYNYYFKSTEVNEELQRIKLRINELKEKIGYYTNLRKEYGRYMKRSKERGDSLEPINYLKNHLSEIVAYEETSILFEKLENALRTIKEKYNPEFKFPVDFEKRYEQLLQQQSKLNEKLKSLNPYGDRVYNRKWMAETVELLTYIRKVKDPQDNGYTIAGSLEIQSKIASLEDILIRIKSKNKTQLSDLNECIRIYFSMQHSISDAYTSCKPVFSMEEHALLLEREGCEYPIANVGSKSNYMFLHLCFFLGLHELLMNISCGHVLNFLFIDQPSIPYYADNKNEDLTTSNDDQRKLRDAFGLINRFMTRNIEFNNKHPFQIIMVEHAGPEYWEGIYDYFKTRYIFTRENGLIPNYVYKVK